MKSFNTYLHERKYADKEKEPKLSGGKSTVKINPDSESLKEGDYWHPDPDEDRKLSNRGAKLRAKEDKKPTAKVLSATKKLKPGESYMDYAKRHGSYSAPKKKTSLVGKVLKKVGLSNSYELEGEVLESAVPGKPAEKVGALTNIDIPQSERDAARARILAKAKAMRDKKKMEEELEIDEALRSREERMARMVTPAKRKEQERTRKGREILADIQTSQRALKSPKSTAQTPQFDTPAAEVRKLKPGQKTDTLALKAKKAMQKEETEKDPFGRPGGKYGGVKKGGGYEKGYLAMQKKLKELEKKEEVEIEEGMTMKDFKKNRSRQKQKDKREAEKTSPLRRAGIHDDKASPERAARHRANVDPDYDRDDEEDMYPGGKLKNPKKILKAKATGEITKEETEMLSFSQFMEARRSEKEGKGSPESWLSYPGRETQKKRGDMGGRHWQSGGEGGSKTERGRKKSDQHSQAQRLRGLSNYPEKPGKYSEMQRKRKGGDIGSRFD